MNWGINFNPPHCVNFILMTASRKLACIVFTDIVGYTSLMGSNEKHAFGILQKNRSIQKPIIEELNGKILKEMGDGMMAVFETASEAVTAALRIQENVQEANEYKLRIGIHLGEVIVDQEDIFGDGVNIASRIQSIAEPGCIYISESVRRNISNKPELVSRFVKEEILKNVQHPAKIYEVIRNCACLYAKTGEIDKALNLLEIAIKIGSGNKTWILQDPDYDALRENSRFIALMEKIE